jgi:hypothetical protein
VSLPGAYIHPNPDLLGGLPSLGRRESFSTPLTVGYFTELNLVLTP